MIEEGRRRGGKADAEKKEWAGEFARLAPSCLISLSHSFTRSCAFTPPLHLSFFFYSAAFIPLPFPPWTDFLRFTPLLTEGTGQMDAGVCECVCEAGSTAEAEEHD